MSTNYITPGFESSYKAFRNVAYLKYNALSGTQSGQIGTTFVAPSTWYITQYDTLYYVDPTPGTALEVIIPDAGANNLAKTISFKKPKLTADISPVTIKTTGNQNVGPTTSWVLQQPGEGSQLVSNNFEFANSNGYKWRFAWENVHEDNVIHVDKERNSGFSTIGEAVSSIKDSSSTNPYLVSVGVGTFLEDTIVLPPYVNVIGASHHATTVASKNGDTLFVLNHDCAIHEMTLSGANNVGAACVKYENSDAGIIGLAEVESCDILDNYYGLYSNNPAGITHLYVNGVFADGRNVYPVRYTSNTGWIVGSFEQYAMAIAPGGDVKAAFWVDGINSQLEVYNSHIRVQGGNCDVGVYYYNGSNVRIHDTFIENTTIGISGEYLGIASVIEANSLTIEGAISSIVINHPENYGFIQGFYPNNNVMATEYVTTTFTVPGTGRETYTGGVIWQRDRHEENWLPTSTVLRDTMALGVITGGQITLISGLSAIVEAGNGYVQEADGDVTPASWSTTTLEIPSGTTQYIVFNPETNQITYQASQPSLTERIVFGRIVANSEIDHIERIKTDINHHSILLETALRRGLGAIYKSGSSVTANTALQISVTDGSYYYGSQELSLSGGNPITWESYYMDASGGYYEIEDVSTIDNVYYNSLATGSLVPLSGTYWTKHALYGLGNTLPGEDRFMFVYASTQYSTSALALDAALPTTPSFMGKGFVPLASLILQASGNDVIVGDLKPRVGATEVVKATAGGSGGVTVHSALLGLDADDHEQYLLVDGTRSMAGNLNMGGNQITNVGNVDGVNVSTHAARHLPNSGTDALTTGTPSTINQTNQEGIQPAFARQDHIHAHGSQSGSFNHALATDTTHGFLASSDYTLNNTINSIVQTNSATWNTAFVHLTGDTMTGQLKLSSNGAFAPLQIIASQTPTSLVSGNMWMESEGLFLYTPDGYINQLNRSTSTVGAIEKVEVTQTSVSSISATSIEAYLFSLSGWTGDYKRYTIPAKTDLVLTDNSINYLIINYNSGSPEYQITTTPNIINNSNICIAATMSREGSEFHYIPVDWGLATAARENNKGINVQRFTRISGLTLSESAGMHIDISSGVVYYGVTNYSKSATSSSPDNAYLYYRTDATTWTKSLSSTYNNSQYQTASNGLSSLGTDKYAVNWVYRFVDGENSPNIAYVLGAGNYTLAEALASTIPTPPTVISRMAILVGRIIVKNGDTSAAYVQSAFTEAFAGSQVTNHENLDGLLGGTNNNHYHLDSSNYNNIGNWNSVYSSTYETSGNWNAAYDTAVIVMGPIWTSTSTTVNTNSARWQSSWTTVNSNSATTWNYQGTDIKALTSGFVGGNSAYTTVNSLSSNWSAAYIVTNANSGNWNSAFTYVNANSATDANVNTVVQTNSATTWNYQGTDIKALTGNWAGGNSAYTTVNSLSSRWDSDYTTTNSASSNWNSAFTYANTNSAVNINVNTVVQTNSANWQGTYTTVQGNSGNWTPATTTGYIYAYDTTLKTTTTPSVWQNLTYNTNVFIDTWTHTAGTSAFVCGQSGIYNMAVLANAYRSNNNDMTIEVKALKNFVEIPGSYTYLQLHAGNGDRNVNTITTLFMVSASVGDIIGFQWATNDTGGQLLNTAGTGSAGATTTTSTSVRITRLR